MRREQNDGTSLRGRSTEQYSTGAPDTQGSKQGYAVRAHGHGLSTTTRSSRCSFVRHAARRRRTGSQPPMVRIHVRVSVLLVMSLESSLQSVREAEPTSVYGCLPLSSPIHRPSSDECVPCLPWAWVERGNKI
ncbi:hypothetical protein B0H12DRAFT_518396 [Mycena haematopus]|nr:hypothetical protein B0H12DRAFT_518396 [Mycena haematopus]